MTWGKLPKRPGGNRPGHSARRKYREAWRSGLEVLRPVMRSAYLAHYKDYILARRAVGPGVVASGLISPAFAAYIGLTPQTFNLLAYCAHTTERLNRPYFWLCEISHVLPSERRVYYCIKDLKDAAYLYEVGKRSAGLPVPETAAADVPDHQHAGRPSPRFILSPLAISTLGQFYALSEMYINDPQSLTPDKFIKEKYKNL